MIPVLFRKGSTVFNSLGLGPLPDTIECTVHEERNGVYELEMKYPVTGLHYADIEVGKVIRARNAYCGLQPFDIYAISRPMNGVVTVNASHVSYRLNKKVLNPCSGSSAASAMASIGGHIMDGSDFLFWTDKTTVANWSATVPQSVRAALGGTEGSILDVYGGEFEWDNFDVKLYGSRGTDTGIFIKYGKNLLDVVADENGAELFTACVPFFKARDDTVTIASVVKTAEWSADNNYTTVMDMGQYFEAPDGAEDNWHPTTAQMESKALALMNANAVSRIAQNLTVKFALLSQSDEYANLAALERVKLCDTVTVTHPGLGVDAKLKVIDTKWNVLLDRYDDIELGQPKASLSETIIKDLAETFGKMEEELADKVDWTHMDAAIENATNLLAGGDGGYVVIGRNAAGEPNEIFIMDQPDTTQAVSVIRLNRNGIGFSTQGINGPYTNAWTIDGHLVADFIDTGIMDATIIKAGVLADRNGNFSLDLPTGTMTMKRGSINIGNNFIVNTSGQASMRGATITGGSLTTENGLYKNIVVNGRMYNYYDDDYIGKVGTSLFSDGGRGLMIDIGIDAEYGGIAIQEEADATGTLAFFYERDDDVFKIRKPLQFSGSNYLQVSSIKTATGTALTITGDTNIKGHFAVKDSSGNTQAYVSSSSGRWLTGDGAMYLTSDEIQVYQSGNIGVNGHQVITTEQFAIYQGGNVGTTGNAFYVNGSQVVTRADINIYADGTIKWKDYDH